MRQSNIGDNLILELLGEFESKGILYVIPHEHEKLALHYDDLSIDVLVPADQYQYALELVESVGLEPSVTHKMHGRWIHNITTRFKRSTKRACSSGFSFFLGYPTYNLNYARLLSKFRERLYHHENINVRLVSHLAYISPSSGKLIQVGLPVTSRMIERRSRDSSSGVFKPREPDELAHLICRGVCDFGGLFPKEYIERSETLINIVVSDPEFDDHFQQLLSLLFFKAGSLVYELAHERDWNQIQPRLITFAEY